MKRFSYIIISACSLLAFVTSCRSDNYLHYDTDTASLRFSYVAEGNDSIVYSFRLYPDKTEDVVEIPVRLIGLSLPYDRTISAEAITDRSSAVENVDFVIEKSELMADSIKGFLRVTVKKTDALNDGNLDFYLRLSANDDFGQAPVNQSEFRIVLTNKLTAPEGWIFGEYSQIKHEFVIKHTGVATNYYNLWSSSEKVWWKSVLINALYEYNKEHPDDPLKDENGFAITF